VHYKVSSKENKPKRRKRRKLDFGHSLELDVGVKSSVGQNYTKVSQVRKFGIEIEAKGMTPHEVAGLLTMNGISCFYGNRSAASNEWKATYDGSVSNGFELVSPPLECTLENLNLIKRICELLNDAGVDTDRKCGLHVHIDAADLSAQHIANVYNRYLDNENIFDSFMPLSRRGSSNQYCRSLNQDGRLSVVGNAQSTTAQRRDRYRKVNLCSFVKYGTIEFRQHSGTVNGSKIVNWIKLLQHFVEASRPEAINCEVVQEVVNVAARIERRPITARMYFSGKRAVVWACLQQQACSAEQLALACSSTVASIQSMICHMRRDGAAIDYSRGMYRVAIRYESVEVSPARTEVVERQVQTSGQLKGMWYGVPAAIKTYYDRRTMVLS
jgi:biotin operon repressor